jgi:hypothetical protein
MRICRIYVDPGLLGSGLGHRLLDQPEDHAIGAGWIGSRFGAIPTLTGPTGATRSDRMSGTIRSAWRTTSLPTESRVCQTGGWDRGARF